MIGVIVDGQGDYAALRSRCYPGCILLKTDGPRGANASPRDIVRKARKQIAMAQAAGCGIVVLVLDLESRPSYQQFTRAMTTEVAAAGLATSVRVVVANRMFENWYLADIESLSKKCPMIRPKLKQKRFEGKHGKKELRKLFRHGYSYHEVRHAATLFRGIDFARARINSSSFDTLLTSVHPHTICQ